MKNSYLLMMSSIIAPLTEESKIRYTPRSAFGTWEYVIESRVASRVRPRTFRESLQRHLYPAQRTDSVP